MHRVWWPAPTGGLARGRGRTTPWGAAVGADGTLGLLTRAEALVGGLAPAAARAVAARLPGRGGLEAESAAANPGTPPAPPRRLNGAIPTSPPPDRMPSATGPKESPAWDG